MKRVYVKFKTLFIINKNITKFILPSGFLASKAVFVSLFLSICCKKPDLFGNNWWKQKSQVCSAKVHLDGWTANKLSLSFLLHYLHNLQVSVQASMNVKSVVEQVFTLEQYVFLKNTCITFKFFDFKN